MAHLSKYFYEATAGKTCRDLCHPQYASCWTALAVNVFSLLPGSYKLFFPLLAIPPLIKGGGYTRQYWRDHTLSYSEISFKTYLIAVMGLSMHCCFYKIFGRHKYYWIMGATGFFSATIISFYLSRPHLRLQGITYFNMMLEVILKKSKIRLVQVLRESKLCATIMFMVFNTRIMEILQHGAVNQFWMMHPAKIRDTDLSSVDDSCVMKCIYPCGYKACSHERSCDAYILDGVLKYSFVGFTIEFARAVIAKFPLLYKQPNRFLPGLRRILSFKLMFFLAAYIGIYRVTGCLLCRHHGRDHPMHNRVAAFLSGASYFIYPKYQVFTLAFTKFVEMSWDHWFKTTEPLPEWATRVKRIPFLQLAYMIGVGYMYHALFFHAHLSPPFNNKALNYCSGNRIENMKRRIVGWMLETEWSKV
ncbi:transmembrane protein 135-like [Armigeres subalbatus]|uniref:transmembrane protein 135-like n=1 Tax=Armigeres subalbatus TaxID=124917 RepID=UPI002ED576A1